MHPSQLHTYMHVATAIHKYYWSHLHTICMLITYISYRLVTDILEHSQVCHVTCYYQESKYVCINTE